MTGERYRILILEDRPEDRELIERELLQAKIPFEGKGVDSREEYADALKSFNPDVVLSDFSLPRFDALEALTLLRRHRPGVPFILVTGAQSEEVAVECMKRGADDYILKATLKRLPSAVVNVIKKRDIQREKERAEENLRNQEDQVRLIADHSRDLIYLLDDKGQFTYASPSFERTLGMPPDQLVGRKAFPYVHPDDKAAARAAFQEALATGRDRTAQFRYKHRDGSWRLFESVVSFARDEKGSPGKAVVVARDIEDRRRLEEQVRQAQKMEAVGRLAGGVAHDFNNLLTAINGYSDLLLRSLDKMDPRRSDVEEIKETAARAAALTQQLLAFSRRQMTQPTVMDLNQVVSNLEKMLRRLIGEDIALRTTLAPDLLRIKADIGQMEQVLLNLTVNARDAMPEGGTLLVETRNIEVAAPAPDEPSDIPPGSYVLLTVTDTGCGMDTATLSHLFEPFFTTKDKGRGTGLGLSTVYGIVQQAGGHIRVASEPGRGTTFRLYFPRVTEAAGVSEKKQETEEFFKGNETILLAEDDRSVRRLAARILTQSGYRVIEAVNGEEALRWADERPEPLDILVTDVVMHGVSGPELARRLTAARPGLKVLYLSGYMESDMRNSILQQLDSAFLAKPFRPGDLLKKVREILDGTPSAAAAKIP